MTVAVLCPAKVNLFLAVGPPDSSGYHPLRTVFQTVSLFDELTLRLADSPSFSCSDPTLNRDDNTVLRALRLVSEGFSLPPLGIHLEKRIPAQSGLGGGSSDAAGLLRAIDKFLPVPLPPGFKHDIAVAVGADVPFFLVGGRAKGEGYGEILTPLSPRPEETYVLAMPEVGCSTPDMFRALDAKPREWRDFPTEDMLYNDFERVAPCGCLELIERLMVLGANDAGLSGSGSAVFGRFSSAERAEEAAEKLNSPWRLVVRPTTEMEPVRVISD